VNKYDDCSVELRPYLFAAHRAPFTDRGVPLHISSTQATVAVMGVKVKYLGGFSGLLV
jgi:hypothetical protein